jgi:hypothetical protein
VPKKSRSAEKVWVGFLSKRQEVRVLFSQSVGINKLIKQIKKTKNKIQKQIMSNEKINKVLYFFKEAFLEI